MQKELRKFIAELRWWARLPQKERDRYMAAVIGSEKKPKKKNRKKLVNVMRNKNKRFPFLDTFSGREQGFGHSRGK